MATILLILAHPDDESFVGGGTLTHYSRLGHETALLCLTNGQAGRWGPEENRVARFSQELGEVRRRELRAAAEVLEIQHVLTPGLPDGALAGIPDDEGIALVSDVMRRIRPQVVLSFGPEGGGSAHLDHMASWRWTHAAFDQVGAAARKYYWITWPPAREVHGTMPTCAVDLGAEIEDLKRKAFALHQTQQDHFALHQEVLAILDGAEWYHLAKSTIPLDPTWEEDLLGGRD